MRISIDLKKLLASVVTVLLIFCAMFFLISTPLFGAQHDERKKIVVLFSFRPTLPIAAQWDRGLRSIFDADQSHDYLINIEHLDLTHFGDEKHLDLLKNLYRYKYADHKPDLIIPVLGAAIDLVLDQKADLFNGVPIVFGGVEKQFLENLALPDNATGHLTDINYTKTLELALRLHPNTRNIVIVGGAGNVVKNWVTSSRKAYQSYEDRFDITYLIGLPMQELLSEVTSLPPQTIIISLPVLRDGNGQEFIANEVLKLIAETANAPVYTFWDICLGTGVVGGHVGSFEKEAQAVAQLGLRVLNGENPSDIPITQAPKYENIFDWQQLKRWGIPEARLPEDSVVINRELNVFEQHTEEVVVILLLLGLQFLAILYLVHQRRIRYKAELELSEKRSEANQLQTELTHMGRVVTVSTLTAALAHEINQPLAAMRSYAQAALRFMDADESPNEKVRTALKGIVSDNKRAADIINRLRDLVKKQEPHRELLDINLIINDVLSLLNSEVVLRNASIQVNLCSNLPEVHADTVQIQQVVLNLLINALDAVSCHPVELRGVVITTRLEETSLVVSIWDSGDGVPIEALQTVFEPFHTTKQGGMGLGLAICKSIVEAHDGTIWAACADAGGAVFSFSLPGSRK
jgi:signal transduction histidine kinase